MKHRLFPAAFAAFTALLLAAPSYARPDRTAVQVAKEDYIVVLQPSLRQIGAVVAEHAAQLDIDVTYVYQHALKGYAGRLPVGLVPYLEQDSRVQSIEPDGVMSIDTTQSNATWGLDRVDQRPLPLDTTFTYNRTGAGLKAYIIDTGIRLSHSEFGGRASSGRDTVDGDFTAEDCNGHGTHVAGSGARRMASPKASRLWPCACSAAAEAARPRA